MSKWSARAKFEYRRVDSRVNLEAELVAVRQEANVCKTRTEEIAAVMLSYAHIASN